jgi:protein SCO1/2
VRRRDLLLTGSLALLAACTQPDRPVAIIGSSTPGRYKGAELDPARSYSLPDTVLLDSTGVSYNLRSGTSASSVTAPVTVLFFGYSNCPDVCTGIIADIATARNRMAADLRGKVRIVVVTTDPARDTPPVLRTYLDRIDPALIGLTGDLATIVTVAESVGVSIDDAKKLPSGGYEVVHSTQVIGFGKDHRAAVVWTYPTSVGDLRTDFETMARS